MQTNKHIALALSSAITRGDWDRVDSLLDDRFVYISDARPPLGKQSYIAFMRLVFCEAMKDIEMSFPRVVAEGDLVAIEYSTTMTHGGEFLGIPATGRRVVGTGHLIREVKEGRVTSEWQTTNALGLMAQIGAAPPR
jgi:predicted ester cyclase